MPALQIGDDNQASLLVLGTTTKPVCKGTVATIELKIQGRWQIALEVGSHS